MKIYYKKLVIKNNTILVKLVYKVDKKNVKNKRLD